MAEQMDARFIAAFKERFNRMLDLNHIQPLGSGRHMQLSALFKVSPASARKWVKGQNLPTADRLVEIAKRFNTDLNWLLGGDEDFAPADKNGNPRPRPVIPQTTMIINGRKRPIPNVTQFVVCRADWLSQIVSSDPTRFTSIGAVDQSMRNAIVKGDIMLVDTAVRGYLDNEVYVFTDEQGHDMIVRRVHRTPEGEIQLSADGSQGSGSESTMQATKDLGLVSLAKRGTAATKPVLFPIGHVVGTVRPRL